MTGIVESTEAATPPEAKRFGKGAELSEPPTGNLIAGKAVYVDVERVAGQVSGL